MQQPLPYIILMVHSKIWRVGEDCLSIFVFEFFSGWQNVKEEKVGLGVIAAQFTRNAVCPSLARIFLLLSFSLLVIFFVFALKFFSNYEVINEKFTG